MASLIDVIKKLEENNQEQKQTSESLQSLNKLFTDHFKVLKRQQGDQEEARRESQKSVPGGYLSQQFKAGQQAGEGMRFPLFALNPLQIIGPLLTGITAFGAAMAGMRGWEVGAISKISTGVNDLVRNVLKGFGVDPLTGELDEAGKRRLNGKFFKGTNKPTTTMIVEAVGKLKNTILSKFGILDDGKIPALDRLKAMFDVAEDAKPASLATRLGNSIARIVSIPLSFIRGITLWTAGAGAKLLGTLDSVFGISATTGKIAGGLAKFIGGVSKVLWPLGFLISLYDGFIAYQEKDADGYIAKLGAGVGGFLGSFIGAPFDLLKSAINWIWDWGFGVTRDEDGNVTSEGWASWASDKMSKFSFVETIKSVVSGFFGMVQGAVDWVKLLFTDPKAALDKAWDGLLKTITIGGKAVTKLLDIFWMPANLAIDWITKKFGWREDDAPTFNMRESLTGWITDFWDWFTGWLPDVDQMASAFANKVYGLLPEWAKDTIDALGPSDKFKDTPIYNQKKMMTNPRRGYESGEDYFRSGSYKVLEGNKNYDELFSSPRSAPVIINNIDQSQQQGPVTISKTDNPIKTVGPTAVDNHFMRNYSGIPGRYMYGG